MDLSGKSLGKYKIIRKLGSGGMGNVFLGQDTVLDRMVAIKLLAPALAADSNFAERFQLEARALARLDHPAIVSVFDADWIDHRLYLAMEYVEGGSVQDVLKSQKRKSTDWILKILGDTAEGIDYAHSVGLIHRDIKPANILIDHLGQAQITDFGLVKDADVNLTAAGQRLGTPAYMAPEQIQGSNVGPAVDIYALGIVAYEMFAGRPPFQGTISAVYEGHLMRPPPHIREFNPSIPESVQAVISRALAKRPDVRYPSAGAFIEALTQSIRRAESQGETLLDPAAAKPSPQPKSAPAPQAARTSSEIPQASRRWFSGLGFGAFGIGTVLTIIVLCLCGAGFLYIYGDTIFGLETPEPAANILFQTGFDSPAQAGFPTQNLPEGGLSYEQGGYLIRVDTAEWIFWGTLDRAFSSTTIEVDISNRSAVFAGDYGIICRYLNDSDFYYGFISADGFYGIGRLLGENFQVLSPDPTGPHNAIRTGNSNNRLRMDCDGSTIRLYANGTLLTQADGVQSLNGDVGLLAGAPLQGGVAVVFDNLKVSEVRGP